MDENNTPFTKSKIQHGSYSQKIKKDAIAFYIYEKITITDQYSAEGTKLACKRYD